MDIEMKLSVTSYFQHTLLYEKVECEWKWRHPHVYVHIETIFI